MSVMIYNPNWNNQIELEIVGILPVQTDFKLASNWLRQNVKVQLDRVQTPPQKILLKFFVLATSLWFMNGDG